MSFLNPLQTKTSSPNLSNNQGHSRTNQLSRGPSNLTLERNRGHHTLIKLLTLKYPWKPRPHRSPYTKPSSDPRQTLRYTSSFPFLLKRPNHSSSSPSPLSSPLSFVFGLYLLMVKETLGFLNESKGKFRLPSFSFSLFMFWCVTNVNKNGSQWNLFPFFPSLQAHVKLRNKEGDAWFKCRPFTPSFVKYPSVNTSQNKIGLSSFLFFNFSFLPQLSREESVCEWRET